MLGARPESARADSGRAKIPEGGRFAAAALLSWRGLLRPLAAALVPLSTLWFGELAASRLERRYMRVRFTGSDATSCTGFATTTSIASTPAAS